MFAFPCNADKTPAVVGGFYSASDDAAVIELWRKRYPLMAAPTGPLNGFDILDIDRGGEDWLATYEATHGLLATRIVATRSGGVHLYFQHCPELKCSAGLLAPHVDIRSTGGYCILWDWVGLPVLSDAKIGPWPMLMLLEEARGEEKVTPSHNDGWPEPILYEINYARKSLGNAWYELRNCEGGRRNHLLNVLSYKLGRLIVRGWIGRDQVEDYLLAACEANGLLAEDGRRQCRATIASGIEAGMRVPYHDIRGNMATGCNLGDSR
jgi:hypothetical protein